MPNAANGVTITSATTVIFCTRAGDRQPASDDPVVRAASIAQGRDDVLALTVYNSGSTPAEIKCDDCHPDVTAWPNSGAVPADQWMPLPAGASVTLRANRSFPGARNQIDKVSARCPTGTTTIGWGVTEWG